MKRASIRADMTLLLVAAIWGSGFVAQRVASRSMGPLTFNSLRYCIGFALLGALLWKLGRWKPTRSEVLGGAALGVVMGAAAWLQQAGVEHTTTARAGFFTGLYVLLVPVIGLAVGERARVSHVAGAVIAAGGLWLLSGKVSGGLKEGDPLIMACAVLWAVHVVLIAKLAPKADVLRLAAVQFAVVAALSGVLAVPLEHDQFATVSQGLLPLVFSGVFVIGIAFTLQIVGQRESPPTHAAVLMSMEAIFAAGFGYVLLSEGLNRGELAGCGLMLAGCLLSQLWPHKRSAAELAEISAPVR